MLRIHYETIPRSKYNITNFTDVSWHSLTYFVKGPGLAKNQQKSNGHVFPVFHELRVPHLYFIFSIMIVLLNLGEIPYISNN